MPNIGVPELVIILVIALLVLGPGRLPSVAQSLGKSIREFRKAATDVEEAASLDVTPTTTPTTTPAVPAAQAAPAPVPATAPVSQAATVEAPAPNTLAEEATPNVLAPPAEPVAPAGEPKA